MDDFKDQNEFWYTSKSDEEAEGNIVNQRKSDKWWLPVVKVPPTGLSDGAIKWIQFQKDNVNQVLKAAMAINAQVLSEMEIPDNYIESLPKVMQLSSCLDSAYLNLSTDTNTCNLQAVTLCEFFFLFFSEW